MQRIFLLLLLSSFSSLLPSNISASKEVASNETDLLALISFKEATSFAALPSWNDSLHHCQWQGVRCGRRHPDRVIALSLGSFNLSGRISPALANLTFLRSLNLSDNQLTGNIPAELGRLRRLRLLYLGMNYLYENIPSTLGNCSNLESLYLEVNNLQGIIPSSLGQCINLRFVSLRFNFLVGGIPREFGSLDRLEGLNLGRNNLKGPIPFSLGNLTNLLYLYLYENSLTGSIPSSLGQLESIEDFNLRQNNLSGTIPNVIYNLSTIVYFDLGSNQFEGDLPSNLCDVLPNLQDLLVYLNKLSGPIPISLSNCSAMIQLDLADNNFKGRIPDSIGNLQNLLRFTVEKNKIKATHDDWRFFDSFINCTLLEVFNLGSNQLQGVIPSSVANLSSNLKYLGLYLNQISGSIPAEIGKLTNLYTLEIGATFIEGTIPDEMGKLENLGALGLSYNMLSGEIPSTLGNLTRLTHLRLQNNAFIGSIPVELSNLQALDILNLSNNKLTGSIPKKIFDLRSLSISLDLSNNYLNGSLPLEIGELKNLVELHLSNNKLFGQIPNTIADCELLQVLHLDGNQLNGLIPFSLSNMIWLQDLDISNNALSGPVPDFLGRLKLQHLNISFNNFKGKLPEEGVFKNASAIGISGNPKLCGGVPEMHLPKCVFGNQKKRHRYGSIIALCCIGGIICLSIIAVLIARFKWKHRPQNNPQPMVAIKYEYQRVSYNDILRATNHFSSENLIGKGTFGVVYKACMRFENVTTVAVKVLNLEQHGAFRSFLSECEVLRKIKHRNLMKILSVCSSTDHQGNEFKALIFEFMPNGSLEAWLHPNMCKNRPFRTLSLVQRLNTAIDVATALDYLHYHGPSPIVHCDLKPSNVLLKDDMTALVGDFGLARFLVQPDSTSSRLVTTSTDAIKGSIGYIPPEYGMGGQASVEGDTYSYGILLLEIFTGVSPTDERFKDGLSLHEHVKMAFSDHIIDIIDCKLFSAEDGGQNTYAAEAVHDCLVSVLQCALLCSKVSPQERIGIKEVVKELSSARVKLLM